MVHANLDWLPSFVLLGATASTSYPAADHQSRPKAHSMSKTVQTHQAACDCGRLFSGSAAPCVGAKPQHARGDNTSGRPSSDGAGPGQASAADERDTRALSASCCASRNVDQAFIRPPRPCNVRLPSALRRVSSFLEASRFDAHLPLPRGPFLFLLPIEWG